MGVGGGLRHCGQGLKDHHFLGNRLGLMWCEEFLRLDLLFLVRFYILIPISNPSTFIGRSVRKTY
jgi:hypothetical protein